MIILFYGIIFIIVSISKFILIMTLLQLQAPLVVPLLVFQLIFDNI